MITDLDLSLGALPLKAPARFQLAAVSLILAIPPRVILHYHEQGLVPLDRSPRGRGYPNNYGVLAITQLEIARKLRDLGMSPRGCRPIMEDIIAKKWGAFEFEAKPVIVGRGNITLNLNLRGVLIEVVKKILSILSKEGDSLK